MTRWIFMGSPDIAVPSLKALQAAGYEIACVLTQPDKRSGRGQKLQAPAVKLAAEEMGIPVLQETRLQDPGFLARLKGYAADGIVVVAYGRILPKEILTLTRLGCINVHFSLLPKYRGAACVAYPLMLGDEVTGVTTMLIDEGLDTGPILMQRPEPIGPNDTADLLGRRLAQIGAQLIVSTLQEWEAGKIRPVAQQAREATYAPLLKKEQGRVDWSQPYDKIYNLYRGLSPWPGLFSFLLGRRILLSELRPAGEVATGDPGTLEIGAQGEMFVNCGEGKLRLLKLKPEGKRVLRAEEFVRGLQEKEQLRFT
jgi:methionyl-tRNA formyltransferase